MTFMVGTSAMTPDYLGALRDPNHGAGWASARALGLIEHDGTFRRVGLRKTRHANWRRTAAGDAELARIEKALATKGCGADAVVHAALISANKPTRPLCGASTGRVSTKSMWLEEQTDVDCRACLDAIKDMG